MMNSKKIIALLFVVVVVFLGACKKDSDTITSQTIHGQVYNLCNDSGMANITVYLQQNGNNIAQLNSDANGNFSFSNVQVHSSNDYTYGFYIPSKSGIAGVGVGFDGVSVDIVKSSINSPFILSVVPHTKDWYLYFPASISPSIYNDTFTLVIQQNTYHKNMPNGVYSLTLAIAPCPN